jgi:hypothetical protein
VWLPWQLYFTAKSLRCRSGGPHQQRGRRGGPITLLKEQGDESDLFLLHHYQVSLLLFAQAIQFFMQVTDLDCHL